MQLRNSVSLTSPSCAGKSKECGLGFQLRPLVPSLPAEDSNHWLGWWCVCVCVVAEGGYMRPRRGGRCGRVPSGLCKCLRTVSISAGGAASPDHLALYSFRFCQPRRARCQGLLPGPVARVLTSKRKHLRQLLVHLLPTTVSPSR